MSLHLYSGPPKAARQVEDLDDEACERYLRQAAKAKSWIPSKLSFEEIMKNKTLPPCSLNDFMDYLMYVEHKAEYLQFFMWYCDYLERWTALAPEKKALAPKWNPEAARKRSLGNTPPSVSKQAKRSASVDERNKLGTILDMMDREADRKHAKSLSTSSAASSLPSIMETVADTEGKWVPYSSQPFREEVNKAVRHYLTAGAPRQIALSEADRTAVLHAVENTTHPSALLPAFATAEAVLRGRCHPNFVRWSVSNANHPLTWCLRVLGATVFLAGLALDVLLVLSHQSRVLRLAAVPLWAVGLVVFLTSWHGLSLPMYWRNRRQLRPWDRDADGDVEVGFGGSRGGDHSLWRKKHKRSDTATSTLSHVDPLRKPSLQTFGPDNGFGDAAWVAAYRRRFWGRRVCDDEVASQNGALRGLQWRVVVVGALMAVATTGLLAVGFWFVPAWPVLPW